MMMMVINAAMYCVCCAWVITGKCQTLNMFCCFVQKGNTLEEIPNSFLQANTSPQDLSHYILCSTHITN